MVLAQFQNSAPQYMTLADGFWKALSSLPITYDYSAYQQLFQTYGTHYLSEGSLGGEYQALLELDRQAFLSTSKNFWCDYHCFWYFNQHQIIYTKSLILSQVSTVPPKKMLGFFMHQYLLTVSWWVDPLHLLCPFKKVQQTLSTSGAGGRWNVVSWGRKSRPSVKNWQNPFHPTKVNESVPQNLV